MYAFLSIVHIIVCFCIIGLVLLQQGKGAEMGASFGAGASQTVFGAQGAGNFFSRTTAIFATLFFLTCLTLTLLVNNQMSRAGLTTKLQSGEITNAQSEPSKSAPDQAPADANLPDLP